MIKYIESQQDFDTEILGYNGTILVDFFAVWCAPCKMLSPILEKISEEHPDIEIAKIDIDKLRDLAIDYEIEFVPTMIIFKNGKESDRLDGLVDEKTILDTIKKYQ